MRSPLPSSKGYCTPGGGEKRSRRTREWPQEAASLQPQGSREDATDEPEDGAKKLRGGVATPALPCAWYGRVGWSDAARHPCGLYGWFVVHFWPFSNWKMKKSKLASSSAGWAPCLAHRLHGPFWPFGRGLVAVPSARGSPGGPLGILGCIGLLGKGDTLGGGGPGARDHICLGLRVYPPSPGKGVKWIPP